MIIFSAFKKVFINIRYIFIAALISTVIFAFAVLFPNWRLVTTIITSETATFTEKISIPLSLFSSIGTNFSIISASYTVLISILFGINMAMNMYMFAQKATTIKQSGLATSMGGVASGALGVGCASCGSLLLTSILPLVGMGGSIALLPFGGQEFGIIGVFILGLSIFLISKKMQALFVCENRAISKEVNKSAIS